MKKKYVCIGDFVISQSDGQLHYISAVMLPKLYQVSPQECIFTCEDMETIMGLELEKYTILRPRNDGNYTLPGTKKQEANHE